MVWRGAHDRWIRRTGSDLAGPHPRGDCRTGTGRRAAMVRQTAIRDGLSRQGCSDRGETTVSIEVLPSVVRLIRGSRIALVLAAAALLSPLAARATNIERVTTPAGIEVWLVRDSTVPLIAIEFGFRGGATQDP